MRVPATPDTEGITLLAVRRAEEMASSTERLLAPWRDRVEELSHTNGGLEVRASQAERLAQAAQPAQVAAEQQAALARQQAGAAGGASPWWGLTPAGPPPDRTAGSWWHPATLA